MNCNLESGRVLAAVDDTYAELLLLSRLAGGSGGDGTEIASDELDAHLHAYHDGDTHALHDHFKNEGRTKGWRWGCGSLPTFEERLERFEAPNPA